MVDPLLRAAIALLVLGVAAIAFAVSFEAIRAFAITSGAFPPALGWCAPLLVDTFTAATTLVILSRARHAHDLARRSKPIIIRGHPKMEIECLGREWHLQKLV